jgi:hypothetical protein
MVLSVDSSSDTDIGTYDVLITGTVNQVFSKSMTFTLTVNKADICDTHESQITEGLSQPDLVYQIDWPDLEKHFEFGDNVANTCWS